MAINTKSTVAIQNANILLFLCVCVLFDGCFTSQKHAGVSLGYVAAYLPQRYSLSQCGSISAPEIQSFSVWQHICPRDTGLSQCGSISAPEIQSFSVWQHICPRDTVFLSVAAYLPQKYTLSQCGSISAPEIQSFSVWQHICPRDTLFLWGRHAATLRKSVSLGQICCHTEKECMSGADMLPH